MVSICKIYKCELFLKVIVFVWFLTIMCKKPRVKKITLKVQEYCFITNLLQIEIIVNFKIKPVIIPFAGK